MFNPVMVCVSNNCPTRSNCGRIYYNAFERLKLYNEETIQLVDLYEPMTECKAFLNLRIDKE